MAAIQKTLTAADETIILPLPSEKTGRGTVHYGAGGLGTIVLEGYNGLDQSNAEVWFALGMKSNADETTVVANLAAAGAAFFNFGGLKKIRVRKSVAGAGPVDVGLCVGFNG